VFFVCAVFTVSGAQGDDGLVFNTDACTPGMCWVGVLVGIVLLW
jgi:hypothetical protein